MDPEEFAWVKDSLQKSDAAWKVCFFHQPLYSDAKFHGPDVDLRARLVPIFRANGVRVVLSGHEHVYERLKTIDGINYFVLGNAGELRPHNLRPSAGMAKGFDTDRCFMLMEIAGNELYFQTISRTGETVDSGSIEKAAQSMSASFRWVDHRFSRSALAAKQPTPTAPVRKDSWPALQPVAFSGR
jgi:3',5'-cyclic AMP phosphodiesterase CpdA